MKGTQSPPDCRTCPAPPRTGSAPSGWVSLASGIGFLALAALAVLAVMGMTSMLAIADAGVPGAGRQGELIRLVRQECGFCHGLRLTGGLGSPLTAGAMQEKPAETLAAVILHGIPGTAMPGWRPFLSDADVSWIVRQLREGFPHED